MHHLHVRKERKQGCGRSPMYTALCTYMGPLKGVGSYSARRRVCSEGSESDGTSKGDPGVSAARALQWYVLAVWFLKLLQPTDVRNQEWSRSPSQLLAVEMCPVPGCRGSFPGGFLLCGGKSEQARSEQWRGRQTLFGCAHWQGKRQWVQIKPQEIPSEYRKTFF